MTWQNFDAERRQFDKDALEKLRVAVGSLPKSFSGDAGLSATLCCEMEAGSLDAIGVNRQKATTVLTTEYLLRHWLGGSTNSRLT